MGRLADKARRYGVLGELVTSRLKRLTTGANSFRTLRQQRIGHVSTPSET